LNVFEQGLTVGVIGMGITFAVLGVVVLLMVLLRSAAHGRQATPLQPQTEAPAEAAALPHAIEEEVVAAIAVALAHLGVVEASQGGLGSSLEAGHGPWWRGGHQPTQPRLPGRGAL
jgi:sodium pump decarboxylase gamma subunit